MITDSDIADEVQQAIGLSIASRSGRETWGLFRGSEIGYCRRRLCYSLLGYEATPFSPRTLSIFEDGHAHEDLEVSLLKAGGVDVTLQQKEVVLTPDGIGPIVGHIDGAIYENLRLLEIKSMGPDAFVRFRRCTVETWPREFPEYDAQAQFYMTAGGFEAALILGKAKASSERHMLLVPYSEAAFARALDRLRDVIGAVREKRLCERDYNDYHCFDCAFRTYCRPSGEADEMPEHLAVTWLRADDMRKEAEEMIAQVREEALFIAKAAGVNKLAGGGVAMSKSSSSRMSCDWKTLAQLVQPDIIEQVKKVSRFETVRFTRTGE